MGAAVEVDMDFGVGDRDVGGRVDEVTEDVPGIGVAAHATRRQAVQAAGNDQQRHVEVHIHTHRR